HSNQTVQRGLAGQKSGFRPMLVMAHVTENPHPSSRTDQSSYASIRNGFVVADRCRIVRKTPAKLRVRNEEPGSEPAERNDPAGIGKPEPSRTRPDFFLVAKESNCKIFVRTAGRAAPNENGRIARPRERLSWSCLGRFWSLIASRANVLRF